MLSSQASRTQKSIYFTILGLHTAIGAALAGIVGADSGFIGVGLHAGLMVFAGVAGGVGVRLKMRGLLFGYAGISIVWFAYCLFTIILLLRIATPSFLTSNLPQLLGSKTSTYLTSKAEGRSESEPILYTLQLVFSGVCMLLLGVGTVAVLFMKNLTYDLEESSDFGGSLALNEFSSKPSTVTTYQPPIPPMIKPPPTNPGNPPPPPCSTRTTKGFGPLSIDASTRTLPDRNINPRDTQWGPGSVASSTIPRSTYQHQLGRSSGDIDMDRGWSRRDTTLPRDSTFPRRDTLPRDTLPRDTLPRDTLPRDTLPRDTLPATPSPATPTPRPRATSHQKSAQRAQTSTSHVCPDDESLGHGVKVVKRYHPMLEDEVALEVGDVVQVGERFEDGWGSGMNLTTGDVGAFPLSCLAGVTLRTAKRVQSIYGKVGGS
ncbi:hypothetical protein BC829DRAFT_491627 [Chytridium lagenaria]|nr:hypothetical protein BC829DRAFT_491627 [Chytridium lagenaria]